MIKHGFIAAARVVPFRRRRVVRAGIRFCRERTAKTAVSFAIAFIPLVALVGAAVDYNRASSVKVQLQAALDATALMVSKTVAATNATRLNATANTYFLAQFKALQATNVTVDATSNPNESSVVITGSVDLPTTFLAAVGIARISLSGSSSRPFRPSPQT